MELGTDDFIRLMLKLHQVNSSQKWRLIIKNDNMEKSDLTLSNFVQYGEDLKFWVNA